MTPPAFESQTERSGWIRSAKWTCVASSFLLAINLIATILLANVPGTAVIISLAAAVLFAICAVGYLTERKWAITYTLILVLLAYVGAGLYWLQTKQWM